MDEAVQTMPFLDDAKVVATLLWHAYSTLFKTALQSHFQLDCSTMPRLACLHL